MPLRLFYKTGPSDDDEGSLETVASPDGAAEWFNFKNIGRPGNLTILVAALAPGQAYAMVHEQKVVEAFTADGNGECELALPLPVGEFKAAILTEAALKAASVVTQQTTRLNTVLERDADGRILTWQSQEVVGGAAAVAQSQAGWIRRLFGQTDS